MRVMKIGCPVCKSYLVEVLDTNPYRNGLLVSGFVGAVVTFLFTFVEGSWFLIPLVLSILLMDFCTVGWVVTRKFYWCRCVMCHQYFFVRDLPQQKPLKNLNEEKNM